MPEPHYDFYVVLGCFGLNFDEFITCRGIENTILKVNSSLNDYNKMMDYFDQCRLFDRPLLELNAVRHFIYNLQDRYHQVVRPLWVPKKFEMYQKFVIDHRNCGVYVKLALPEDKTEEKPSTKDQLTKLRRIK